MWGWWRPQPRTATPASWSAGLPAQWTGASPEQIVHVLEAARQNQACLPVEVVHTLAAAMPVTAISEMVAEDEILYLRQLRNGATVDQVAATVGYSERTMYCRLRDLYCRLGVSHRAEAVEALAREGLLD